MNKENVTKKIQQIAERETEENGLELVQVELIGADGNLTVRIFIDKEGGVTHEDCSRMSFRLGEIMDAEDFVPSAYTLEVSSPGIERELYKLKDYVRFAGSLAKMKTRREVGGQRNFRGRIIGVENEDVIFEDKTSGQVKVPFADIKTTKLEIDIQEEFRKHDSKL
jgi:ribosome maturation factor RimP